MGPLALRRLAGGWLVLAMWKLLLPLAAAFGTSNLIVGLFADTEVRRELARIRAAGQPIALSDLAQPRVDPARNPAFVYIREANALSQLDERMLSDFTSRDPARKARVSTASVRRALSQAEDELARVRRASALPRCQFPVNWTGGADAQFPHYAGARRLARILGAHARLCAIDGRRREAMADVAAILGIARHVGQEPVLLASLVEYAIISTARATLQNVLRECSPRPSECTSVVEALAGMDLRTAMVRMLEGERCLGLSVLQLAGRQGSATSSGGG